MLQTFRYEPIEWNNFKSQKNKKGTIAKFWGGGKESVEREIAVYKYSCGEYRKEYYNSKDKNEINTEKEIGGQSNNKGL